MNGENALVLSGGSVKGSFQAGAILAVLESGFIPDIIYGISVGSLNGAFLTNAAGIELQHKKVGSSLTADDWGKIGKDLKNFWLTNIRKPDDVAKQRSFFSVFIQSLFKNFKGLSDTTPINKIVDTNVNVSDLTKSPVKLWVGAVDVFSSKLIYRTQTEEDFMSYLKGSIAIPMAMPPSYSANLDVLFDGGVRDVAPLNHAIKEGAKTIYGILCQSKELNKASKNFEKKPMQLMERIQDIIVNQNVRNDEEWVDYINELLIEVEAKGIVLDSLKKYRHIDHKLIQPPFQLTIDITNFNAQDIADNIKLGYETAKAVL
jgi:NTE family protein